jgi:hypothetical protein
MHHSDLTGNTDKATISMTKKSKAKKPSTIDTTFPTSKENRNPTMADSKVKDESYSTDPVNPQKREEFIAKLAAEIAWDKCIEMDKAACRYHHIEYTRNARLCNLCGMTPGSWTQPDEDKPKTPTGLAYKDDPIFNWSMQVTPVKEAWFTKMMPNGQGFTLCPTCMQSDWIKQSEDKIETVTIDSFKVHSNSMTSRWLSTSRVLLAAALEQAKQIYIKTHPQTRKTGKEINPDFDTKASHMIDKAEVKFREQHASDIKDGGLLDPAKKIGLADTEIIDELLLQMRF